MTLTQHPTIAAPVPTRTPAPTTAPAQIPTPAPTLNHRPPTADAVQPAQTKIDLSRNGIDVADYADEKLTPLQQLNFGWIQVFNPPDYPIKNFKILYRVPLGAAISGRPADIDAWALEIESLAREHAGIISAYSIGNEVNLAREWGGNAPDPLLYTQLLAIAYARIKTADPNALVISAGIAPTGGDSPGAVDDLAYARAMLEAGALNFVDGYGFHPYGFAYAPDHDPSDAQTHGLLFRRAEAHHDLLVKYGGAETPMWATEFGWLLDPAEAGLSCDLGSLNWQKVSAEKQARWTVQAIDYAARNWPWMGPMFLWNYDFSRSQQYPDPCEQMKWFSLLNEDGSERKILTALRAASK
ncbi:MAG: hypothetical protein NTZ50_14925 [Chloroflexi bacterium]|nr:hypothetical protein [Chloroflexota bacterium]